MRGINLQPGDHINDIGNAKLAAECVDGDYAASTISMRKRLPTARAALAIVCK
jgi:hypothetical protein